jgi:thiopurine S-methyltransferase
MDAGYWIQRWNEGRTGWHHDAVMPLLESHWPALSLPRGARVLVPLCGKTLDMVWLASQGYRVLGVEFSQFAIEQFFAENHLQPQRRDAPDGAHFVAGDIEVICGDVFGVDAATLAGCAAVYDRAAVIALPAPVRRRYADEVYAKLPPGCPGLMITLEYPPGEMDGPPFSVDDDEIRRLFDAHWQIALLDRRDILASQPEFTSKGVTALHTSVYRLLRR